MGLTVTTPVPPPVAIVAPTGWDRLTSKVAAWAVSLSIAWTSAVAAVSPGWKSSQPDAAL